MLFVKIFCSLGYFSYFNRYKLHLEPDLEKCTFTGSVEIELEFKASVNEIEFHSLVNISSYKLETGGTRMI